MTEIPPTPPYPERMNAFMTTEHFTLQSARNIINSEIASRVSIYFVTLSSVLIATAFLAQAPRMDYLFRLFAWIAFPVLLLLGLFTFARLMVLGMMDFTYVRAINRIRQFYAQAAPEVQPFMLFPPHDDDLSVRMYGGFIANLRGNLLSAAQAVQITNSIVTTVVVSAWLANSTGMTAERFLPFGLLILVAVYVLYGVLAFLLARSDFRPGYRAVRFPAAAAETRVQEAA